MKNNECIIYIKTPKGSTQTYRKKGDIWTQKSSKGIVRKMTAEQLLSHLLPPLANVSKSKLIVKVQKKK